MSQERLLQVFCANEILFKEDREAREDDKFAEIGDRK
jgi:hypothetical protein